ncbi:MAG: hypothetical protein KUG77_08510, partial [Nannocystaceae bacterium]|nr:hypothetical protein [Nannocystaceae bacterium]
EPAPPPAAPKTAEKPPTEASPPQRTLDEPVAPRRTPNRMKLGGQAHVQAGLGLGAIATPSGAVGLGGGLTLGRWQVDLAGRLWLSQRLPMPQREELGAEVLLWTAGLRAGPILNWGRFEFPVQAGVDGGLARGRGYGITTRRVSIRPWVSVGLFPGVLWRLGERFGFGLVTELSGVILRPLFRISDVEASIAPARVRGGMHGRIQVRFP